MATTGHLFENMMATCNHLDIARLWKKYGVEPQQGDLSSVFTTVVDADTLWHLQFFNAVTIESPGAVRRDCYNHESLLVAVRETAETQNQSAVTGILSRSRVNTSFIEC